MEKTGRGGSVDVVMWEECLVLSTEKISLNGKKQNMHLSKIKLK